MRERDEQKVVRLTIRADSILMIMVVLSSVSVIHPVNPLQAVVAGLSAVLHRYHCEVRHVFITVRVSLAQTQHSRLAVSQFKLNSH